MGAKPFRTPESSAAISTSPPLTPTSPKKELTCSPRTYMYLDATHTRSLEIPSRLPNLFMILTDVNQIRMLKLLIPE
jgi:hypothetical protein